jgi:uncharacterized membrane protein
MTKHAHLWAIGYDDMDRAAQVREEITRLAWDKHSLILEDVAVVVRRLDGSFTFHPHPCPVAANILACTAVGFLAGLVLAAPLTGAAVGALLGGAGSAAAAAVGISDSFVREVEDMMRPGTSALFLLDHEGDMDVILHAIRGLGGTVLETNVRRGAGQADSVHPGRCLGRHGQTGKPLEDTLAPLGCGESYLNARYGSWTALSRLEYAAGVSATHAQ